MLTFSPPWVAPRGGYPVHAAVAFTVHAAVIFTMLGQHRVTVSQPSLDPRSGVHDIIGLKVLEVHPLSRCS